MLDMAQSVDYNGLVDHAGDAVFMLLVRGAMGGELLPGQAFAP